MGYDFPTHSPDDGLGEMAFEVFVRVMRILDAEYELFMKALYTEEELALPGPSASEELMQKLQELRQVMEKRMEEAEAAAEEGKEAAAEAEEECAGWGGGEEDAGEDCAC